MCCANVALPTLAMLFQHYWSTQSAHLFSGQFRIRPATQGRKGASAAVWWAAMMVGSLGWSSQAIAQVRPVLTVSPEAAAQSISPIAAPIATEILFVNPSSGQDSQDGSSWQTPLQTITHALRVAAPGSVIMLAPGTYSVETGEQFPIVVDRQITIQGDPGSYGQGIVITGQGDYPTEAGDRTSVVIAIRDEAALVGVSVINPQNGQSVWIESGQPLVMSNTVWPAQSVYIARRSDPTLYQNQTQSPDQADLTARPASTAEAAIAFPTPSSLATLQSDEEQSEPVEPESVEPGQSQRSFDWDERIAAIDPPSRPPVSQQRAFHIRSDQVGYQLLNRAAPDNSPMVEPAEEPVEWSISVEPAIEPAIALESGTLAAGERPDIAISPELLSMMERQVPIDIPVSAPPGGWQTSASQALLFPSSTVLPVPSVEIPLGNTGSLPMVSVTGGTSFRTGAALRYRVIVEAGQAELRSRIESLVPGAFPTVVNGRSFMQTGAFSDRTNAQELVDLLNDFGFRAIVEPMN